MSVKAKQFLEQKLRETIAECHVPALTATLVRDAGNTIVSAQQGVRKLGASGTANVIQPTDKFNLGSVSKVFTAAMLGKLIQQGVGNLSWQTKLVDVYPDMWAVPPIYDAYKNVTIEQLTSHCAGFRETPSPSLDNHNDWLNYTALDMTKSKLKKRRRQYTVAALLEAPLFTPGNGFQYGGGGIIAASMAEKRSGKLYEDLVKQYIYTPLGMSRSGFGRTCGDTLNGPWMHTWDGDTRTLKPDGDTHLPAFSWNCRAPVGSACASAADMGKFMREQLRPDPQVFTTTTRNVMQVRQVSSHSPHVQGAWNSSAPGSGAATLDHNGDNGRAYAHMVVTPSQGIGYASMSNVSSPLAGPAVHEMHDVMRAMNDHWSELFGAGSKPVVECSHPVPAVTFTGSTMHLFGRRHDGSVRRYKSTNNGANFTPAGDFGPVTINSGLGAAVSADGKRVFVVGRGMDNKAWFGRSTDNGASWQGWVPILSGVFISGIAIACNAAGTIVHAVGIGNDKRMWRARSEDGGQSWTGWSPIGEGVFNSGPAIACSNDGKVVHVVARGNDLRAWHNVSVDSGANFKPHWAPVGKGVFGTGLGCTTSDSGKRVFLMGRGLDKTMWFNSSNDSGSSWQPHWKQATFGIFTSAPVLVSLLSGLLHAFAYGCDFRVWGSSSLDGGATWSTWSPKTGDYFL